MLTLRLVAQGDALQRSDAKAKLLAAATEQTGDLILITRADASYEHANEAFLRVMGYSRAELAGAAFHRSDRSRHGAALGSHHGRRQRTRDLAGQFGATAAGRLDISRVVHGCRVEGHVEHGDPLRRRRTRHHRGAPAARPARAHRAIVGGRRARRRRGARNQQPSADNRRVCRADAGRSEGSAAATRSGCRQNGSRASRTDREKPARLRPPQRAGSGLSRSQSDRPGHRGYARVPPASAQHRS